ncbi:hypothetical protein BESB_064690 [Besnoitia besnoiti]|uniref:Transporter, major facilitator family protein n=1 Tax=Besnoitia besnoiti TaxID=94643 RepID=A0A2A9M7I3_BESBE|nr:hypothetical protein BESB_064690 [Besnoitia besnoiti]PFH34438.1 hypothetical protein BESB_064690 [Besnoitia besnoiti]
MADSSLAAACEADCDWRRGAGGGGGGCERDADAEKGEARESNQETEGTEAEATEGPPHSRRTHQAACETAEESVCSAGDNAARLASTTEPNFNFRWLLTHDSLPRRKRVHVRHEDLPPRKERAAATCCASLCGGADNQAGRREGDLSGAAGSPPSDLLPAARNEERESGSQRQDAQEITGVKAKRQRTKLEKVPQRREEYPGENEAVEELDGLYCLFGALSFRFCRASFRGHALLSPLLVSASSTFRGGPRRLAWSDAFHHFAFSACDSLSQLSNLHGGVASARGGRAKRLVEPRPVEPEAARSDAASPGPALQNIDCPKTARTESRRLSAERDVEGSAADSADAGETAPETVGETDGRKRPTGDGRATGDVQVVGDCEREDANQAKRDGGQREDDLEEGAQRGERETECVRRTPAGRETAAAREPNALARRDRSEILARGDGPNKAESEAREEPSTADAFRHASCGQKGHAPLRERESERLDSGHCWALESAGSAAQEPHLLAQAARRWKPKREETRGALCERAARAEAACPSPSPVRPEGRGGLRERQRAEAAPQPNAGAHRELLESKKRGDPVTADNEAERGNSHAEQRRSDKAHEASLLGDCLRTCSAADVLSADGEGSLFLSRASSGAPLRETGDTVDAEGAHGNEAASIFSERSEARERSSIRWKRLLLLLILGLQMTLNIDNGVVPAVLVDLGKEFNANASEQGLVGALPHIGMLVFCPFCARCLEVFRPQRLLTFSLLLNACAVLLFAASSTCPALFFSRFLIGFSQTAFVVYAPVWIDTFAPAKLLTLWMGLTQSAVVFGVVGGYLLAGFLRRAGVDWRSALFLQAACLLCLILFLALADASHIDVWAQPGREDGNDGTEAASDEECDAKSGKQRKVAEDAEARACLPSTDEETYDHAAAESECEEERAELERREGAQASAQARKKKTEKRDSEGEKQLAEQFEKGKTAGGTWKRSMQAATRFPAVSPEEASEHEDAEELNRGGSRRQTRRKKRRPAKQRNGSTNAGRQPTHAEREPGHQAGEEGKQAKIEEGRDNNTPLERGKTRERWSETASQIPATGAEAKHQERQTCQQEPKTETPESQAAEKTTRLVANQMRRALPPLPPFLPAQRTRTSSCLSTSFAESASASSPSRSFVFASESARAAAPSSACPVSALFDFGPSHRAAASTSVSRLPPLAFSSAAPEALQAFRSSATSSALCQAPSAPRLPSSAAQLMPALLSSSAEASSRLSCACVPPSLGREPATTTAAASRLSPELVFRAALGVLPTPSPSPRASSFSSPRSRLVRSASFAALPAASSVSSSAFATASPSALAPSSPFLPLSAPTAAALPAASLPSLRLSQGFALAPRSAPSHRRPSSLASSAFLPFRAHFRPCASPRGHTQPPKTSASPRPPKVDAHAPAVSASAAPRRRGAFSLPQAEPESPLGALEDAHDRKREKEAACLSLARSAELRVSIPGSPFPSSAAPVSPPSAASALPRFFRRLRLWPVETLSLLRAVPPSPTPPVSSAIVPQEPLRAGGGEDARDAPAQATAEGADVSRAAGRETEAAWASATAPWRRDATARGAALLHDDYRPMHPQEVSEECAEKKAKQREVIASGAAEDGTCGREGTSDAAGEETRGVLQKDKRRLQGPPFFFHASSLPFGSSWSAKRDGGRSRVSRFSSSTEGARGKRDAGPPEDKRREEEREAMRRWKQRQLILAAIEHAHCGISDLRREREKKASLKRERESGHRSVLPGEKAQERGRERKRDAEGATPPRDMSLRERVRGEKPRLEGGAQEMRVALKRGEKRKRELSESKAESLEDSRTNGGDSPRAPSKRRKPGSRISATKPGEASTRLVTFRRDASRGASAARHHSQPPRVLRLLRHIPSRSAHLPPAALPPSLEKARGSLASSESSSTPAISLSATLSSASSPTPRWRLRFARRISPPASSAVHLEPAAHVVVLQPQLPPQAPLLSHEQLPLSPGALEVRREQAGAPGVAAASALSQPLFYALHASCDRRKSHAGSAAAPAAPARKHARSEPVSDAFLRGSRLLFFAPPIGIILAAPPPPRSRLKAKPASSQEPKARVGAFGAFRVEDEDACEAPGDGRAIGSHAAPKGASRRDGDRLISARTTSLAQSFERGELEATGQKEGKERAERGGRKTLREAAREGDESTGQREAERDAGREAAPQDSAREQNERTQKASELCLATPESQEDAGPPCGDADAPRNLTSLDEADACYAKGTIGDAGGLQGTGRERGAKAGEERPMLAGRNETRRQKGALTKHAESQGESREQIFHRREEDETRGEEAEAIGRDRRDNGDLEKKEAQPCVEGHEEENCEGLREDARGAREEAEDETRVKRPSGDEGDGGSRPFKGADTSERRRARRDRQEREKEARPSAALEETRQLEQDVERSEEENSDSGANADATGRRGKVLKPVDRQLCVPSCCFSLRSLGAKQAAKKPPSLTLLRARRRPLARAEPRAVGKKGRQRPLEKAREWKQDEDSDYGHAVFIPAPRKGMSAPRPPPPPGVAVAASGSTGKEQLGSPAKAPRTAFSSRSSSSLPSSDSSSSPPPCGIFASPLLRPFPPEESEDADAVLLVPLEIHAASPLRVPQEGLSPSSARASLPLCAASSLSAAAPFAVSHLEIFSLAPEAATPSPALGAERLSPSPSPSASCFREPTSHRAPGVDAASERGEETRERGNEARQNISGEEGGDASPDGEVGERDERRDTAAASLQAVAEGAEADADSREGGVCRYSGGCRAGQDCEKRERDAQAPPEVEVLCAFNDAPLEAAALAGAAVLLASPPAAAIAPLPQEKDGRRAEGTEQEKKASVVGTPQREGEDDEREGERFAEEAQGIHAITIMPTEGIRLLEAEEGAEAAQDETGLGTEEREQTEEARDDTSEQGEYTESRWAEEGNPRDAAEGEKRSDRGEPRSAEKRRARRLEQLKGQGAEEPTAEGKTRNARASQTHSGILHVGERAVKQDMASEARSSFASGCLFKRQRLAGENSEGAAQEESEEGEERDALCRGQMQEDESERERDEGATEAAEKDATSDCLREAEARREGAATATKREAAEASKDRLCVEEHEKTQLPTDPLASVIALVPVTLRTLAAADDMETGAEEPTAECIPGAGCEGRGEAPNPTSAGAHRAARPKACPGEGDTSGESEVFTQRGAPKAGCVRRYEDEKRQGDAREQDPLNTRQQNGAETTREEEVEKEEAPRFFDTRGRGPLLTELTEPQRDSLALQTPARAEGESKHLLAVEKHSRDAHFTESSPSDAEVDRASQETAHAPGGSSREARATSARQQEMVRKFSKPTQDPRVGRMGVDAEEVEARQTETENGEERPEAHEEDNSDVDALSSSWSGSEENEEEAWKSHAVWKLFRNPLYMCLVLALCSLFFEVTAIQFWATRYFEEELHADTATVLISFSTTAATAPAVGIFAGAFAMDFLGGYRETLHQQRRAVCCLVGLSALCASLGLCAAFAVASFWPALALVWLLLFAGGTILPTASGLLLAVVDGCLRAKASGTATFFYTLLGYTAGAFLPGLVSDALGTKGAMQMILLWPLFGFAFLLLAFFFVSRLRSEEEGSEEAEGG